MIASNRAQTHTVGSASVTVHYGASISAYILAIRRYAIRTTSNFSGYRAPPTRGATSTSGRTLASTNTSPNALIGPGMPGDHPPTDPAPSGGTRGPHNAHSASRAHTPARADQSQQAARDSKRQRRHRTRCGGRSSGALGTPSCPPTTARPRPPSSATTMAVERRNLIVTARNRHQQWVSTGVKGRFGR